MITKERLEELIKKKATIYYVSEYNDFCIVHPLHLIPSNNFECFCKIKVLDTGIHYLYCSNTREHLELDLNFEELYETEKEAMGD